MNQPDIELQFNPEDGVIGIASPQDRRLAGGKTRLSVVAGKDGRWAEYQLSHFRSVPNNLGTAGEEIDHTEMRVFEATISVCGLRAILLLTNAPQQRYAAYKLRIENVSPEDLTIRRIVLFDNTQKTSLADRGFSFSSATTLQDPAFFSNGWQSWAYSGTYGVGEKQRKTMLQFIPNAASSYPLTPYWMARGHFSSDFFGVIGDRHSRLGLLFGFLSQKHHFGSITAHLQEQAALQMWANGDDTCLRPGSCMETDWAVVSWIDVDAPEPLQQFYELAAGVNRLKRAGKIPTGWCSWYHFYTKISEEKISDNMGMLAALKNELPLDLVQIDDGYQTNGGDWFSFVPAFPNGLAPLAVRAREKGMTPGLWMAPFIVSNGAQIMKDHPEYILRNFSGRAVSSGLISDKFSAALDLSCAPALDYACKVVATAARDWGFAYLKLDFLYAGALPGKRYDFYRTRAQILRTALEAVRRSVGDDTYLLGCGVPLGSALGLFDAMRIGADTGGTWKPKLFNLPFLFKNDPQIPSLSNALQNTITRSGMHLNWWVNDPDCLLVRPQTDLTTEEVRTHATAIALTGGSLILSDDLPNLPRERLRIAEVLLPLIGKRPQVLDWFDRLTPRMLRLDLNNGQEGWHLLAMFNWQDHPVITQISCQEYRLPVRKYWARSFWDETLRLIEGDEKLWDGQIAAHGVILLAVREYSGTAQYLGSNLHISQGMEIEDWIDTGEKIICRVDVGRQAEGYLELYLPSAPVMASFEHQPVAWEQSGSSVFRFHLQVQRQGVLEIHT